MLIFLVIGSIPERIITAAMGCLGIAVGYGMRLCLSIAITEMVLPINSTDSDRNLSSICSFDQSPVNLEDLRSHQMTIVS